MTTFNVIFVRRTVRLLRLFLHSLQARTRTVRFRLVANGCTRAETRLLRDVCEGDDRFGFLEISRTRVLRHPRVLSELLALERSQQFAFMDSDCFVTGDPFPRLLSALNGGAAAFAGQVSWLASESPRLPPGHRALSDAYRETPDGRCAGCSYVAVYDRRALSACLEETGVAFQEYHWDELPPPVRAELQRAGLRLHWYDTGKVVNLLLGLRGHGCRYVELPHLWHVGAVSSALMSRRRRLRRLLHSLGIPRLVRPLLVGVGLRRALPPYGTTEKQAIHRHATRREAVSAYVAALLQSLDAREPEIVAFEHPDPAVVSVVNRMKGYILQLHQDRVEEAGAVQPGSGA